MNTVLSMHFILMPVGFYMEGVMGSGLHFRKLPLTPAWGQKSYNPGPGKSSSGAKLQGEGEGLGEFVDSRDIQWVELAGLDP